jgi:hypothetical protein
MRKLFAKCWTDDAGAILATEFLFLASVLVIGLGVGLAAVRNAVNSELTELANSVLALNQSYVIPGQVGPCGGFVEGTAVINFPTAVGCPISTPPSYPVVYGGCSTCNSCDVPCW